jgi:hypothetical protein
VARDSGKIFEKVQFMSDVVCDSPFDALRQATESLPAEAPFVRATARDLWSNLIPREEYPMGTGLVQSVFTTERSEPTTDEPEFERISFKDGEDQYQGTCGTTYNEVPVGFTEKTYGPEQFGWKGPVICEDDLIYSYRAEAFWQNYIPAIAKHSLRTIGNRLAAIFTHFVPKAAANTDFNFIDGGTGHPPTSPDLTMDESLCELSQEMLDATAIELMEEGADAPNSDGWIQEGEEGPIFPLMIGIQASQRLLLMNPELRLDYRNAYMGAGEANPLLKRIGATRVMRNFRHVPLRFPPRYTYDGTGYVRVPTWIMPDKTKGQGAEINPAWKNAHFEGAYIPNPWVFHSQIIKPVLSLAGMNWPPKNYQGEWKLVVGGAKINDPPCHDPLEKLARHFAEYKHAPKPIFPKYGRFIIFNRCPGGTFECVSCS